MFKRLRLISLVVAGLGMLGGGCAAPHPPLRLAISAWAGVEPAELAAQLGYYARRGVDVQLVRFSAYSDSIEALRDGKVDAGLHTLDDALRLSAAERQVRTVLLTDYSYGGDGLVVRAGITAPADLRGKKIGVEVGTVGHYSLMLILQRAQLAITDVAIVSIPAWEIQQAMVDGRIDAGVTWEPYLTSTAQQIGGQVLITSRDYPETILTTLTFDAAVVQQRPADVQNVVAAYFDAVQYLRQNPADAYRRMAQAEGISAEEFAGHAAGLQVLDLAANQDLFGAAAPGRVYAKTQAIAQFLFEHQVIKSLPDVNAVLAPQFVRALQP